MLGWSQDELVKATGGTIAKRSLIRFESGETTPQQRTLDTIRAALEAAGVVFLADGENAGGGVGVRLKGGAE
jgi:transcriptional regulator with XRE-family HTH domain